MEPMILYQATYLVVALIVAVLAISIGARKMANARTKTDYGDDAFFMLGIMACGFALMWPISIFGGLSMWLGSRARKHVAKQRMLAEELSQG